MCLSQGRKESKCSCVCCYFLSVIFDKVELGDNVEQQIEVQEPSKVRGVFIIKLLLRGSGSIHSWLRFDFEN